MADDSATLKRREKEILNDNENHLTGFEEWLKNKGLSPKTINTHVSNVDFYINTYLCYYDSYDVKEGAGRIDGFLGSWFIRKALWSSCAHIKSNAVGIKKFYAYLLEKNVVEQDDYDDLCETIKECMPDWLDKMRRYDEMIFADYY